MTKGLFAVVEGIDGSGKTTLLKNLNEGLARAGITVVNTHEPGGSSIGPKIREMLLSFHEVDLIPQCEIFLFAADRAQHVHEVLRPGVEQNKLVLSSRYFYASLAYQGYGRGVDLNLIHSASQIAIQGMLPEVVLLLDIDPEESKRRMDGRERDGNRRDRFEVEAMPFHHRVRNGYLELAKQDPGRFVILDASQASEVVAAQALEALLSAWKSRSS